MSLTDAQLALVCHSSFDVRGYGGDPDPERILPEDEGYVGVSACSSSQTMRRPDRVRRGNSDCQSWKSNRPLLHQRETVGRPIEKHGRRRRLRRQFMAPKPDHRDQLWALRRRLNEWAVEDEHEAIFECDWMNWYLFESQNQGLLDNWTGACRSWWEDELDQSEDERWDDSSYDEALRSRREWEAFLGGEDFWDEDEIDEIASREAAWGGDIHVQGPWDDEDECAAYVAFVTGRERAHVRFDREELYCDYIVDAQVQAYVDAQHFGDITDQDLVAMPPDLQYQGWVEHSLGFRCCSDLWCLCEERPFHPGRQVDGEDEMPDWKLDYLCLIFTKEIRREFDLLEDEAEAHNDRLDLEAQIDQELDAEEAIARDFGYDLDEDQRVRVRAS